MTEIRKKSKRSRSEVKKAVKESTFDSVEDYRYLIRRAYEYCDHNKLDSDYKAVSYTHLTLPTTPYV